MKCLVFAECRGDKGVSSFVEQAKDDERKKKGKIFLHLNLPDQIIFYV